MPLIVENGTGVAGANTYINAADAVARAAVLGFNFPNESDAETPLIRAAIYLEGKRLEYQGTKYISGQPLQWPRDPVYIDNEYNDPNTIPQLLIDAQVYIASVDYAGGNLFATSSGSATTKSVGDVSVTKTNAGELDNTAVMGFANEMLKPLMKSANYGLLEFPVCRA
jgi:hypothetical protein